MKIEMRDDPHLWILVGDNSKGENLEVIIDKEHEDVRICDGSTVIKVCFDNKKQIISVLENDVYINRER
jgi:hypothetical protein